MPDLTLHLGLKPPVPAQCLNLDRKKLVVYIMAIEDGYNANPYHNRGHAADVVARSYAILKRLGMSNKVESKLRQLAMLLAAAAHDTQHPGFNNAFIVRNESPLSRKFNDQAVLENHSLHMSLELIRDPNMNFLKGSVIGNGQYWRMVRPACASGPPYAQRQRWNSCI